MPNLTIYAPQYLNQYGKSIQAQLKINAANSFKYYSLYPYFASHLSNKPISRLQRDFKESTVNELLARARRVILFTDTSELKPMKFTKKYFGEIAARVHKAGDCDHLSYWMSYWNTRFVLNEPYRLHSDYMLKLAAQGLVAIELPTDISPYCGRWNPTLGATPWTGSFLICDAGDLGELESLFKDISEGIQSVTAGEISGEVDLIPAWNSLKGLHHV